MAHKQLVPENVPSWLLPRKTASTLRACPPPRSEAQGSELWQRIYKASLKPGGSEEAHIYAAKMADTALKAREKSLAILTARPKLLVTKEAPKAIETVVAAKKGRTVPNAACRCKAQTLEGKQCGFKATCGDFCKKHVPS
jgi:hypothetical protein